MVLMGRDKLNAFLRKYADSEGWLVSWVTEVENATWSTPHELKERYGSASLLGNGEVVFNVRGNKYRMHCKVNYGSRVVLVKWIGTHAEYSKLNLGR